MHPSSIVAGIEAISFQTAVWLFPIAFAVHIWEEWPAFVTWAQDFASDRFTRRDYVTIHRAGLIGALALAAVLSAFPNPVLVFLFFAFIFLPGICFNCVFHVGATALYRRYCPGAVTAATIYPLLTLIVVSAAWRDGLVGYWTLAVAFPIAAVFHFWEVGHNVFKAW